MIRPFCIQPLTLPTESISRLRRLQLTWHKLYLAMANDSDFLHQALHPLAAKCAWSSRELQALQKLEHRLRDKPKLLFDNSVYLSPQQSTAQSRRSFSLSVTNVQAGEPYQLELVHTLHNAEHAEVQQGPMRDVCATLADAARFVHPSAPCVAILAKPIDRLALRTRIDVRGVGEALRREHGVHTVLYVSMEDMAAARVDASGDLVLGEHRISAVYVRYDFSHPIGRFATPEDAFATHAWQEWAAVERFEASNAIVSSALSSRLAHRRQVQYAFSRPGVLEGFLTKEEAAEIREVLPRQWHLGISSDREEARALFERDQHSLVAKNVLRPRTGSGKTQDRAASGGLLIDTPSELLTLLNEPERCQWYVCYPRVRPAAHDAQIVHNGDVHSLDQQAVSEVATFGAYFSTESSAPRTDLVAGMGARTRQATPSSELARALGYGALSCVSAERQGAHC
uniref:Glutathione synthase n=1 Tax=Chrysotila carterae TaxID=13221 RepID=A0A7S4ES15_CHRCT